MKIKTLVLFAHPDDELLWMGGFLLRYRGRLQVDFICLTSPFNRPRIGGLLRLDRYFNVRRIICLGYEDNPEVLRKGASFDFDTEWMESVDFKSYDLVFSHNQRGEYGHPHHQFLHQAIKKHKVPFISFGHEDEYHFALELDPEQVKEKQAVLSDLYGIETRRLLPTHSYWDCGYERFRLEGMTIPPAPLLTLEGLCWQDQSREKQS